MRANLKRNGKDNYAAGHVSIDYNEELIL